jgi:hypothetical protein
MENNIQFKNIIMGYDIRPIAELNTFDYTLCSGFSDATTVRKSIDGQFFIVEGDTVRKSIDGQFFIVEGDTITTYTQEEMLTICEGVNWTDNSLI